MQLIYNERTKNRKLAESIVAELRSVKAPKLKPVIELVRYSKSDNNYIRVSIADVDYYQDPYWEEYHAIWKILTNANKRIYR